MGTETISRFNRIPLMELSANTPHKRFKPSFESSGDGYPCGLRIPSPRCDLETEFTNAFQTEISADKGVSFVTPLKGPERITLSSARSTSSSLLDDDIDDSFLEEIDIICQQSAARKTACQTPTTSVTQTPSKDNKSSDLKAGLDSMAVESGSYVKLELNEDTTIAADPALINYMPDECSKYMQSLNDRQRDAACSEISTPLMVIAGPGSGKVGI